MLSTDWPVLSAIIAISAAALAVGILPVAADAASIPDAILSAPIPANCICAAPYPILPILLPNNAVLAAL